VALGLLWMIRLFTLQQGWALASPQRAVTGALFTTAMLTCVNAVAWDVAHARDRGELEYYATVPVHDVVVLLGIALLPLTYSLPPAVATLLGGWLLLGVPPLPGWQLVPVYVLAMSMLLPIGMLLGLQLPMKLASAVGSILPLAITLCTPTLVNERQVPQLMAWIGALLPTTHAVRLLEGSLFSPTASLPTASLAIVAATSVPLWLWLVRSRARA
jgi:ABC-2 type transport system permease protein